jgi:hypothetical protein
MGVVSAALRLSFSRPRREKVPEGRMRAAALARWESVKRDRRRGGGFASYVWKYRSAARSGSHPPFGHLLPAELGEGKKGLVAR